MEIEKKRETSWKIQLKNNNESIEITSVEISGEVRLIKLSLLNNQENIEVKMNKEEFYNFLSLLSAFKDVVIGEDTLIIDEELSLIELHPQKGQESSLIIQDLYPAEEKSLEEEIDEKDEDDKLNPEEWDPW
jgi:hypothetical protein